jgi:hypothetical protein
VARIVYDLGRALFNLALAVKPGVAARMMRPQVGDLVVECTGRVFERDSVGRLIEVELYDDDPDPAFVKRYVVAPLVDPERHQGWSNAEFIALPEGRVTEWIGS